MGRLLLLGEDRPIAFCVAMVAAVFWLRYDGPRATPPGPAVLIRRRVETLPVGQLFATIRQLIADEKYVIGQHASERLEERGIMEWQVVAGMEDGILIAERPDAEPNPAIEVRECLPDGTEVKAVWSHLRQSGVAKLVTVHFFDRS
jgi:hypothetical protein